MSSLQIGILGTGYVGQEVIRQGEEYSLWGTTTEKTRINLSQKIKLVNFQWENPHTWHHLPQTSDYLVLTIPPIFADEKATSEHLHKWCKWIKSNETQKTKLIYISTTSVYPKRAKRWREEDEFVLKSGRGQCRIVTEKILQHYFPCYILRAGAIYGPKRNIITRILRKMPIPLSDAPIHRIHVADLASIILSIIRQQPSFSVINCCDSYPDSSKTVTEWAMQNKTLLGLPADIDITYHNAPLRIKGHSIKDRWISNDRLINNMRYRFIYPDWKSGLIASLSKNVI